MPNTFNNELITPLDSARQMLGDTGEDIPVSWLLDDNTINAKLAQYNFSTAVMQLALGLIARYGQMPDEVTDESGTKISWKDRRVAWTLLVQAMQSGNAKEEFDYTGGTYGAGQMGTPDPLPSPGRQTDSAGTVIPKFYPGLRF